MALEPLLHGLFDYAGMFPPAALPFSEALAKSAGFPVRLRRPEMLANDMVLTPESLRLLDQNALDAAGYVGRPCSLCLVGVPLDEAADQAHAIEAWNEERRHQDVPQRITALETHATSLEDAPQRLRAARNALGGVALYFEPKWDDDQMAKGVDEVVGMLHGLQTDGPVIGLKVRAAGPTALGHATLAKVLQAVVAHGVPLKATQGLHHPFAGDPVHGNVHGFLNVLLGLRLAGSVPLPTPDLERLLADPEPAHFTWDDGIGWDGHRALMQRATGAAQAVPFAIGSCSLDEPDHDLAALLD